MPDEAAYFREQAEHCEKLATNIDDPVAKDRLMTLAAEYARRAERRPMPPRRARTAAGTDRSDHG